MNLNNVDDLNQEFLKTIITVKESIEFLRQRCIIDEKTKENILGKLKDLEKTEEARSYFVIPIKTCDNEGQKLYSILQESKTRFKNNSKKIYNKEFQGNK